MLFRSLTSSIAYTDLTRGDRQYKRRYFVSRDQDVMLIHLKSSQPGELNFEFGINRPVTKKEVTQATVNDGMLLLTGTLDSGVEGVDGMAYATCADAKIIGKEGKKAETEHSIKIENADEAWIIISAATSFFENDRYLQHAKELLSAAMKQIGRASCRERVSTPG